MYTKLILLTIVYMFGEGHCICGQIYETGLSAADINTVLSVHNNYRKLIATGQQDGQPKSSNMLEMMYDDNLAAQAQELTNTCNFEHIDQSDPRFGVVGQNLYTYWSSSLKLGGVNWTRAVQAWYNEQSGYTFCDWDYNHYTQVVWADTYKVGCGYTYYVDPNNKNYYTRLLACNYGPGGNVDSETPYVEGPGCENLCQPTNPL